jgi:hypothetical protein
VKFGTSLECVVKVVTMNFAQEILVDENIILSGYI